MKTSVLVVDDELLIRKSLGKVLKARGYAVEVASTGADGLDKVSEIHPHVMILDMRLPMRPPRGSRPVGFVAFALEQAGLGRSNPDLARALDWLKFRQNRQFGYWTADSMNKPYEADSMPLRFMQDAATSFAAMALLEAK